MIVSPDASNQIDGSVNKNILAHLPELPVGIVPVSYFPNFVFKEPEPLVGRWILIDFMEPHSPNEEYNKFWTWVINYPPILTFKRELHQGDVSPVVKPIEWPCYLHIPERSERAQFDSRPLEVLYFWGYSNAFRPKLHGEIFSEGMAKHGLNVFGEWDHWNLIPPAQHNWFSIYTPHWRRKPMNEIVDTCMKQAKITVSMPGNGQKTFRDTECVGTLMALQRSDIAYSYQWDKTNSIQLESGNEFQSLLEATQRTDLYDLYVKCDDNMRHYEARTYANEYVATEIRKFL